MPRRKYIVGNPYGVRPGIPILSRKDGTNFYEGDVWTPQPKTPNSVIQKRLEQGFLLEPTEVNDGREE